MDITVSIEQLLYISLIFAILLVSIGMFMVLKNLASNLKTLDKSLENVSFITDEARKMVAVPREIFSKIQKIKNIKNKKEDND